MGVDSDLRDLACGQRVSSLHLERRSSRLDLESGGKRRRKQGGCDILVNLDDALTEQVFDQMKDWPPMTLQQPPDRGKFPVDVNFGPANRKIAG